MLCVRPLPTRSNSVAYCFGGERRTALSSYKTELTCGRYLRTSAQADRYSFGGFCRVSGEAFLSGIDQLRSVDEKSLVHSVK